MSPSLYERIGGESAVRAAVLKMYEKILDDDLLAPFFEDVDVDVLRRSQMAFVTYAFGGPNRYSGRSMRAAHANAVGHGLDDVHFNHVATHLAEAMRELSVPEALISEALAIVESTRDDVLSR